MFKYLKSKMSLVISREELENLESRNELIEDENKEIISVKNSDIIEIDIKECTFEEFIENSNKINQFNICMRNYVYNESLDRKIKFENQKIYIIEKDNLKYIITLNNDKLIISEYNTAHSNIFETELEIKYYPTQYTISKFTHGLNYSTGEHKSYSYPDTNTDKFSELLNKFTLEKNEALILVQRLLSNLQKIENIDDILYFENIYSALNLISEEDYYPVISDDTISLSWTYKSKESDVSKEKNVNFQVILKETREVIGEISFDYLNAGFSYQGNVGYFINPLYQNHHYATKALGLLKELLKSNEFAGDKDLYVSTETENVKSQKVIENNGGELFYEGSVPENNSLNYIDGVKDVKVYKIKTENKKS